MDRIHIITIIYSALAPNEDPYTMSWFTYLWYKLFAVVVRAAFRLLFRRRSAVPADIVCQIPTREAGRTIKAHVYRSSSAPKVSPILINFHGSGFLFPLHGSDGPFCHQVSRQIPYTVLDVRYRLAPEHPFPAALHDVEDTVHWVLQQPTKFDRSRVAISGFSAGGNLALAAASSSFPRDTFCSILTFYPPLDLYMEPGAKVSPDPTGKPISPALARMFNKCYIPSGMDARDPRISPGYAAAERFPDRVLMVTAAGDNLAAEAETLAARISQLPGREVICRRMHGCNHAWDKNAPEGTIAGDAKEKAYAMAVALLARS